MYVYIPEINYNFKSCLQNLNLHVKPQDLDKRKPHHSDMRTHSHLKENNTLKICTVFFPSRAKKIEGRKSLICGHTKNLNFRMKCGSRVYVN